MACVSNSSVRFCLMASSIFIITMPCTQTVHWSEHIFILRAIFLCNSRKRVKIHLIGLVKRSEEVTISKPIIFILHILDIEQISVENITETSSSPQCYVSHSWELKARVSRLCFRTSGKASEISKGPADIFPISNWREAGQTHPLVGQLISHLGTTSQTFDPFL